MPWLMMAALLLVPQVALAADSAAGAVVRRSGEAVDACEPRSTAALPRLNLDASALRYGVMRPCQAVVDFHVGHHTPLRVVVGELQYLDTDGGVVLKHPFEARLEPHGNGMLQQRVVGEPVADVVCRALHLGLEVSGCRDGQGGRIDCPPVRAKGSYVFEKLVVHAPGTDLCAD